MTQGGTITQICIVVRDVRQANSNWSRVLGLPGAEIVTIFPDGILHYTGGNAAEYKDCQVALYRLDNLVLELIQPGPTPSPWGNFLEKHGQGVFHLCIFVNNRKVFQQRLADIGVDLPYQVGYYPAGSYSYVAAREQLGLELSVNDQADYSGPGLDDGPEYSPDGGHIWFNSTRTGLMQIWRMGVDGSNPRQMVDETANCWFPHVSPDGAWVVYIAYGKDDVLPGDHPPNKNVELRLIPASGGASTLVARLFGGQGTINVNSWSPDNHTVAFVSYWLKQ